MAKKLDIKLNTNVDMTLRRQKKEGETMTLAGLRTIYSILPFVKTQKEPIRDLSPGQTDQQVVASGRKSNLRPGGGGGGYSLIRA